MVLLGKDLCIDMRWIETRRVQTFGLDFGLYSLFVFSHLACFLYGSPGNPPGTGSRQEERQHEQREDDAESKPGHRPAAAETRCASAMRPSTHSVELGSTASLSISSAVLQPALIHGA